MPCRWQYRYRAVDSLGQTIDVLLSVRRDAAGAKRFFAKALRRPNSVNPRTLTVDKNAASPKAVAERKRNGRLWRFARLRQITSLHHSVEQDHCRIKRLVRAGLGFQSFRTARRTLTGYEAMAMRRKGQLKAVAGRETPAQAACVVSLFGIAA